MCVNHIAIEEKNICLAEKQSCSGLIILPGQSLLHITVITYFSLFWVSLAIDLFTPLGMRMCCCIWPYLGQPARKSRISPVLQLLFP